MRRSICYCEPNQALAGEVGTWKFFYTPATNLPKGTRLKFDPLTKGRPIDWEVSNTDPKEKMNSIFLQMPDKKTAPAKIFNPTGAYAPYFEFTLPSEVKAGDPIIIVLKDNHAQNIVQRRRPFHLFVDPKGKGDFKEPEIFTLDVRGNLLKDIRIIAPSLVNKNKRFDVIVRFEDQYGNLTSNAPEGTLIELSYENLRENLSWKLFVPETGFLTLPNLYFNEVGIYRIQLRNMKTNDSYFSAPIKCLAESDKAIYWGLLHGESERVDSAENIETCLRLFRDEVSLQFFATSCFESAEETPPEIWKLISTQVMEFNEEGRYATFLGFQWFANTPEEGLRHIIYAKDSKPIMRMKDVKVNTLKKIYKSHNPKEFISIPSFSMAKGFQTTFDDFTPEFERVVEIYNSWGSSECTAEEGNPRPITCDGGEGVEETKEGSIREALNRNCRFGFVAGGLDDRGIYSGLYESDQEQYSPGMTAILAIEQTREALFIALHNRSCYATTGERMIMGFAIANASIGGELSTKVKPGLTLNRHIIGYVAGTKKIDTVEIIRNGTVLHTFKPTDKHFDFAIDDFVDLSKIVLQSPDERPPFVYYYMRAIQEDGHMAWSSPIWIDYPDMVNPPNKKIKKK